MWFRPVPLRRFALQFTLRDSFLLPRWLRFLRFPIDAVFLEKMEPLEEPGAHGRLCRVRRVYRQLPPWRMTRLVWGAESVLELAAGTAEQTSIEVGDELEIRA